jgi:hypothetical protein
MTPDTTKSLVLDVTPRDKKAQNQLMHVLKQDKTEIT